MMIWLKLFWWMVWRGVIGGAALGALFGTVLALWIGAVFGVFYGAVLGVVTGIVNGIALVILTRFWFSPPQNSLTFRRTAAVLVVICTVVTGLPLMNWLTSGTTFFILPPTIIAALAMALFARLFPQFAVEVFLDRDYPEEDYQSEYQYSR
jgi:hypothetical protein